MSGAENPYSSLARAEPPVRGSVTQEVTNALRKAIVTLAIAPGAALDKGAICAELGVSRFPVSEALARLAGEGLVDIQPQRGSTVSLIRLGDVREHMLIRKGLESEAIRMLARLRPPEALAALDENMALQAEAAAREDVEGFQPIDLAFHDILFSALGLARMRAIIDSARANLDRARRLIVTQRRLGLTILEHQAILEGVRSGDEARALGAARAHIDAVMVELLAFAREHPGLFADGAAFAGAAAAHFPLG